VIERVSQALRAKGYDPDEIERGMDRWMATGYGIDPHQIAFRHYGTSTCQCFECADTPIKGYNFHGLPPEYAPVVWGAWQKANL
jgi:hypothetical protein